MKSLQNFDRLCGVKMTSCVRLVEKIVYMNTRKGFRCNYRTTGDSCKSCDSDLTKWMLISVERKIFAKCKDESLLNTRSTEVRYRNGFAAARSRIIDLSQKIDEG